MSLSKNQFMNRFLYGGGILFDLCKWVILAAVLFIVVHKFWFTIFVVDGLSMEPTIHDKELVMLKRFGSTANAERGDVLAVRYPGDPDHKKYIKRVVGLPGDTVSIKNKKVYINNSPYDEKYIPFGVETEPDGEWKLAVEEYFLMGDNRPGSNDSRYFGAVEKRFFLGKAITIIYPRLINLNQL